MNFIIDKVTQLEHVNITYSHFVIKALAGTSIKKTYLSMSRKTSPFEFMLHLFISGAIENRRFKLDAQLLCRPAKRCFIKLANVHTTRHTKRVKHNIHRSTIRHKRHILDRQNFTNNTLVTVPSSHLVTYLNFPFLGNVTLGKLLNSRREFITDIDFIFLVVTLIREILEHETELLDKAHHIVVHLFGIRHPF